MDPEAWSALVEAVRAFAEATWGDEAVAITLTLRHLGDVGRLPLPLPLAGRPDTSAPTGQDSGQPRADTPDLTPTAEAILRVLERAEKPLKGSAIASRAGLGYTPHFRSLLANLVEAGRVEKPASGGYWPAGKPLPE